MQKWKSERTCAGIGGGELLDYVYHFYYKGNELAEPWGSAEHSLNNTTSYSNCNII